MVKKLESFSFDTQFQTDAKAYSSEGRPSCLEIRIINGFELDVIRALESEKMRVKQIGQICYGTPTLLRHEDT